MNRRPTRADVAKLADVSVATVSYVVNNGPRPVAADTRVRVLAAIEQLGYQPNAIARSLKTGSTQTIALVIQSLVSAFPGHLVNAVEESLARHDYSLIVASSHEDIEREKRMMNVLAAQSIDGLLCVPVSNRIGDHVTAIIEEGIPVVFVDRHIPGVQADVVMTDNVTSARHVTSYLIEQGCRRIMCLPFSDEASSSLDRVEGYCQALREHDLPVDDDMILVANMILSANDYTVHEAMQKALLDHWDTYGLPDGIIGTTDDLVLHSIKALKRRGIQVPEQVKVAGGFIYSAWNALLESPVPMVHQDFELMAQRSVGLLMDRLHGSESAPRIELIDAQYSWETI